MLRLTDLPEGRCPPLLISALLILSFAGCSKEQAGGRGFSMPPMPVEVARAEVRNVEDRFEAVGSLEASNAISVVTEIDAAVVNLPFKEGSFLRRGELIAQLDNAQLAAELSRAEAVHEQSHTNYERVKSVVEQKAGSPQDLDDAAAGLKVADANLAVAKARLAKTRIVAPFDGMVGSRKVSIGTFLRVGQTITELANIDELRVNFSTPERYLSQLRQGAEVTVSVTAYPGQGVQGKIIAIEPVLDAGTRSAHVVARVGNPGRHFRPGMSANVSALLSERSNAVTIPNEAVFAAGTQAFVFVVKPDSTALRVPVTLGTRLADVVEVIQGLASGDHVVRAGHQKLFDGARVLPVSSQSGSPSQ